MSTGGEETGSNGGFALVAVLGFTMLAAAVIAPFALVARTNLLIDSRDSARQKLQMLADGLSLVVSARVRDGAFDEPLVAGGALACKDRGLHYELRLQDQAGLIDLNAASADLLVVGLETAGISRQDASSSAAGIERFRGGNPAAPASVEAIDWKHAPFESVSELYDLPALRTLPLRALYETFTVHSRRGSPVLAQSPQRLAAALGARSAGRDSNIDVSGLRTVAVAVHIAAEDGRVAASSGFIVRLEGATEARRIETLPDDFSDDAAPLQAVSCDAIFGQAAWTVLQDWQS